MSTADLDLIVAQLSTGARRAGEIISETTQSRIKATLRDTISTSPEEMRHRLDLLDANSLSVSTQSFQGEFSGFAALTLPGKDAERLAALAIGREFRCREPGIMSGRVFHEIANMLIAPILSALVESHPGVPDYDSPTLFDDGHQALSRLVSDNDDYTAFLSVAEFSSADSSVCGDFLLFFCPTVTEMLLSASTGHGRAMSS